MQAHKQIEIVSWGAGCALCDTSVAASEDVINETKRNFD